MRIYKILSCYRVYTDRKTARDRKYKFTHYWHANIANIPNLFAIKAEFSCIGIYFQFQVVNIKYVCV